MNERGDSSNSKSNSQGDAEQAKQIEEWRCQMCDHLEDQSAVRCGSCQYWRVSLTLLEPLNTASVQSSKSRTPSKLSNDEALDVAIDRLQSLFTRAQKEREALSDHDRAQLYEALLSSLLKAERTSIKRSLLKEYFAQEREAQRRAHMIHLSVIWFLGVCTGLALYFGLQSVSQL